MIREWRHLKMLKRAGRAYHPEGIAAGIQATPRDGCALLCPACPQPGKNLPDGWENDPDPYVSLPGVLHWTNSCGRSKHALFVGIDANFRLKRRAVSSEEKDPSLSPGWSFFVEETEYKAHLTKFWHQPQEVRFGLFYLGL